MGRIVRLTESQLKEVIKRIINEEEEQPMGKSISAPTLNASDMLQKKQPSMGDKNQWGAPCIDKSKWHYGISKIGGGGEMIYRGQHNGVNTSLRKNGDCSQWGSGFVDYGKWSCNGSNLVIKITERQKGN